MIATKILIPNKEWIITDDQKKIGSISKNKKGFTFLKNGYRVFLKDTAEIKTQLGVALFEEGLKKHRTIEQKEVPSYTIYEYPCSSKPFNPLFNVQKKLPLYSKSLKSKSKYCAGHYLIKFRKGWVKGFCPKLITVERYPYHGPFKTELEAKTLLNKINKNEKS